ncbi:MAG TPA: tRNA (adenosine(37)-N6)-threonylcarbamoyltransferase complex dimerization subunit type 1 TsaB [Capillimicrobium sp.]|nr:tRNA (adenosine(37)-N6)-threonylcarbamoyltransferase complex dimerization subunit type 1 TsaB [Capillimicrobium sp.]
MPQIVLAFDTATSATVVGVTAPGIAEPIELRDDPEPGQRPRHTQELMPLAREALRRADLRFSDVERVVVGTGPGSFTGLRIGLATARALALAAGAELVGVSTLRALAEPAEAAVGPQSVVASVLDARRGEVFIGAWRAGQQVLLPRAVSPERAAELAQEGGAWKRRVWLAVGDGAIRFRGALESVGVSVPADRSPLHRVSAPVLCRLGAEAEPQERTAVVPEYLRLPDVEIALRSRTET